MQPFFGRQRAHLTDLGQGMIPYHGVMFCSVEPRLQYHYLDVDDHRLFTGLNIGDEVNLMVAALLETFGDW